MVLFLGWHGWILSDDKEEQNQQLTKRTNKGNRIREALYGLRQSPLLWLKGFSGTLNKLGLCTTSGVECLFTND